MCEAWDANRRTLIGADGKPVIQASLFGLTEWGLRCTDGVEPINCCPWCGAQLPDDEHE